MSPPSPSCLLSSGITPVLRAPTREDIVRIVHRMYIKDGLSRNAIEELVDTFPNQRESTSASQPAWVNQRESTSVSQPA